MHASLHTTSRLAPAAGPSCRQPASPAAFPYSNRLAWLLQHEKCMCNNWNANTYIYIYTYYAYVLTNTSEGAYTGKARDTSIAEDRTLFFLSNNCLNRDPIFFNQIHWLLIRNKKKNLPRVNQSCTIDNFLPHFQVTQNILGIFFSLFIFHALQY